MIFKFFNDLFQKKPVVKKKELNMSKYNNCTEEEFKYIIEHKDQFLQKCADGNPLDTLIEISNMNPPDGFDKERFIQGLDFTNLNINYVNYPLDKYVFYDYIHKIDLDKLISDLKSILREFLESSNLGFTGEHSDFTNDYYEDLNFRLFAYTAEVIVSKENIAYLYLQKMLYYYYCRHDSMLML